MRPLFQIPVILVLSFFLPLAPFAQSLTVNSQTSSIAFSISNFGIDVDGTFAEVKGKIFFLDANIDASNFDIEVAANSVSTGIVLRDKHLKSENYFSAEKYSKLTFRSKHVKRLSSGKYMLVGDLSIKNVKKEVSIPFGISTQRNSVSFDGSFIIDRNDFGVGKNSLTLGDEVKVQLHIVAEPDSL